jgi:DNA gyrase/topoisomerase IV subunit A
MILVNGAEGIGTGWSTKIPCYNPKDIVHNLKLMIQGSKTLEEMKRGSDISTLVIHAFFYNSVFIFVLKNLMLVFYFLYMNQQGEVSVKNETTKTKKSGVTYTASGIIKVVDKTTLKISELAVKISM